MPSSIITRQVPRLTHGVGLQITATIRPDLSSENDEDRLRRKILALIHAGTSHFRINLSHFSPHDSVAQHKLSEEEYRGRWMALVQLIEATVEESGTNVFIMLDTAGPEFRINRVSAVPGVLASGTEAILSCDDEYENVKLPVIYLSMPEGFESFGGDEVLNREIAFKDGNFIAVIKERLGPKLLRIQTQHAFDTAKSKNIKVNLPGFDLRGFPSVSERDLLNLKFFLSIPKSTNNAQSSSTVTIHYIAQSFVRSASDVGEMASKVDSLNLPTTPLLIPKIETAQAVEPDNLDAIVSHPRTAAVMVARGDLGIECNRWLVPTKQREIVRISHSRLKPVLIATEVYGSMGLSDGTKPPTAWQPNRGEVLDFRHALEAGVDGIVFSAETGSRDDPEVTVLYAARQGLHDEKDIEELDLHRAERDRRRERMAFWYGRYLGRSGRLQQLAEPLPFNSAVNFSTMDWACAAVYRANTRRAIGIFPFTVSGETVRYMAHFLPYRPIVAITDEKTVLPNLALFAHVYPVLVEKVSPTFDVKDLKALVQEVMRKFELGSAGAEALATMPHPIRKANSTDTLVLIRRI